MSHLCNAHIVSLVCSWWSHGALVWEPLFLISFGLMQMCLSLNSCHLQTFCVHLQVNQLPVAEVCYCSTSSRRDDFHFTAIHFLAMAARSSVNLTTRIRDVIHWESSSRHIVVVSDRSFAWLQEKSQKKVRILAKKIILCTNNKDTAEGWATAPDSYRIHH